MDFRKLQYFETVARLRNFTRAAEELHVAQPTITTAIKHMEEELGVPLLVRDKRMVMLTVEGEIFLEKAKDILQRMDQAVQDMQELSGTADWTVNIGIVPISGSSLTASLYKGFSAQYPQVRYKIMEIGSYGIQEAIDQGKLDIGFLVLQENVEERYDVCRVYRSELKALVNLNNPLAAKERISIRDLAGQKLIYFPKHSFIRQRMDVEFTRCGVTPDILAEPVQMITLYNLVRQNAGVSFSIGDFYNSMINCEDVVALPLAEPVYCETGFIWKKGERLKPAARKCLSYVLAHVDEL